MTKSSFDDIKITVESSDSDYEDTCNKLYQYNVQATNGLLQKPGKDINLYLRDASGKVIGGLFCETWLYGLYLDVFWVADEYRHHGYGKRCLMKPKDWGKNSVAHLLILVRFHISRQISIKKWVMKCLALMTNIRMESSNIS